MFKRSFFACLLSVTIAAPAVAAQDGAYLGGGLGVSFTTIKNSATGASKAYSSSGPHLLAGYQFNRNFAVEGEYFNFGEFSDYPVSVAASGYGVSGVGFLPLGSGKVSLFGKMGLASVTTNASVAPGWVLLVPASQTKSGISFGFGASFDVSEKVSLRLSLTSHEYEALSGLVTGRVGMWGVSGLIHF